MNEKITTINIETITPESAKLYLGHNTNNRNISKIKVKEYLEQMLRGQWRLSTDAIAFDTDGVLINGQHRLIALIEYGKPLQFLVGRNYKRETFSIIDTGKNRTAGDVLQVNGVKNSKNIASIIRRRFNLKENKLALNNKDGGGVHFGPKNLNNQEVLDEYMKRQNFYDTLIKNVHIIYQSSKILNMSETAGIISYLVIDLGYEYDKALFFFQEISSVKESNSKTLESIRVKLLKDKLSNKRMTQQYRQGLIIKAWNYYKSGKEISVYTYDPAKDADLWF